MTLPPKLPNLMEAIRSCVDSGKYLDTRHGNERQSQRSITRPELLFVLRHGHHEKKKDRYEERYQAWNYAVRGKTVDRRELRVVVSFDDSGMLIITAIHLR